MIVFDNMVSESEGRGGISPVIALLLWLTLAYGVGFAGSMIAAPALQDWYPFLAKPGFAPPDWAFTAAGTGLYLAMGVAVWQISQTANPGKPLAITFFVIQLAISLVWTAAFFGARHLAGAAVAAGLLTVAAAVTAAAFARIRRTAGWLMAPQFGWAVFLTALSVITWNLSR